MASVLLFGCCVVAAPGATLAAGQSAHRSVEPRPYRVPSQAMAPTLRAGEVVYVGGHDTPSVGDVVVFGAPRGAVAQVCGIKPGPGEMCQRPTAKESTDDWIKRVVAGPGDTIAMDGGHVILNGKRLPEPYADVSECAVACTYRRAIRIAPGYFFMLGDNRGASDDSRFWGPVPTPWIVGRVETCSAVGVSCRYVR